MKHSTFSLIHHFSTVKDESLVFIGTAFPLHIYVFRRIVTTVLPKSLSDRFIVWQDALLSNKLRYVLEKALGHEILFFHRKTPYLKPHYVEYKVAFKQNEQVKHKDALLDDVQGFGKSFDSNYEALSKAIGEFLERYMFFRDWDKQSIIASEASLGGKSVQLKGVPMYVPWQNEKINSQFLHKTNASDVKISWLPATSLLTGGAMLVPTQRVFWKPFNQDTENILNQPTTNGNAGGFSREHATVSALYELIERDSFMCYWLLALKPDCIDLESVSDTSLLKKIFELTSANHSVTFFDITTSINVPVILCVLIDRNDSTDLKLSVGAACGFSAHELFEKSLIEAMSIQRNHWFDANETHQHDNAPEGFFDTTDFGKNDKNERHAFWRGGDIDEKIKCLYGGTNISYDSVIKKYNQNGAEHQSARSEAQQLAVLFRGLVEKYGDNYHPYRYEAEHPLLSKLNYHVVSVVILGLYPLYLTEHKANLDIFGMSHWYATGKLFDKNWDGTTYNTTPHPFS